MKSCSIKSNKPAICFIAHFAYGALSGWENGHIGGIERQMSLMAKWLARRGYIVSMLTWDEGQQDGIEIDGVKVFKMCRKKAGIKGLRFFWPKWTSLNVTMKRADADIYYQNCGEYVTGQVAMWCRRHDKKFVYSVANDVDCDDKLTEMHTLRERILYRYGLKHADKVVVQTKKQQNMLRENFGVDSVVIQMPCPGPSGSEYADCQTQRNGLNRILWIGRICEQKRPDKLLELAKACPDVQFDFVGPAADSQYARNVCRQVKTIPNVTYHGPAEREKVSQFYRNAKIMCCTSDFEGFPNTFLEAWSYGLPVISTFDPDNVITEKKLGKVGNNIPDLKSGIYCLLNSANLWRKTSQNARRYYLQNHKVEKVMEQFEHVFVDAVNSSSDKIAERNNL